MASVVRACPSKREGFHALKTGLRAQSMAPHVSVPLGQGQMCVRIRRWGHCVQRGAVPAVRRAPGVRTLMHGQDVPTRMREARHPKVARALSMALLISQHTIRCGSPASFHLMTPGFIGSRRPAPRTTRAVPLYAIPATMSAGTTPKFCPGKALTLRETHIWSCSEPAVNLTQS